MAKRELRVGFLYEEIEKAQEELGLETHREFVAALFLIKHKAIVTNFEKLRYTYTKKGVIVAGVISETLEWQ